MRNRRRSAIGVAVASAAMVLAGIVGAPPASAATLTASLSCDGLLWYYHFMCDLTITGGTAPYTTSWSASGAGFSSTSTTSASGSCYGGNPPYSVYPTVYATVRDSSGQTVSRSQRFQCTYVAP